MADPISGELVIVPDAEALGTIRSNNYDWGAAKSFAESYSDGVNSDYRLITKSEALEILTNNDLLAQLGLTGTENFWTIEEIDLENAYVFAGTPNNVYGEDKVVTHLVFPVRKVNFYGLPLIESQFGGGLVYDVVAATRTVHVVIDVAETYGGFDLATWDNAILNTGAEINGIDDWALPTRAQALKIFGNSYLVTLAGLPLDNNYWTSEEAGAGGAWCYLTTESSVTITYIGSLFYALPVRSEVVPES